MVSVPVRCGPESVCTVNETEPLPVPLEGLTFVIQLAWLVAVHVQPAPVVTDVESGPPAFAIFAFDGAMEYVQPSVCVIVSVCPATVSVPVRGGPLFGCTVKFTVAAPDPLFGFTSVIQLALLAVVQVQAAAALIVVEPAPPALPIVALSGLIVAGDVQTGVTVPADWVTVND